jgi:hypothetical protein
MARKVRDISIFSAAFVLGLYYIHCRLPTHATLFCSGVSIAGICHCLTVSNYCENARIQLYPIHICYCCDRSGHFCSFQGHQEITFFRIGKLRLHSRTGLPGINIWNLPILSTPMYRMVKSTRVGIEWCAKRRVPVQTALTGLNWSSGNTFYHHSKDRSVDFGLSVSLVLIHSPAVAAWYVGRRRQTDLT